MRFSPSLDAVFPQKDMRISEKIRICSELGFAAFEFWGWWNKDLDEIEKARQQFNMQVASFCTKFVTLVDPSQRRDYLAGLQASIEAANRLDCRFLISQTGNFLQGIPREQQRGSLVEGLKSAASLLEKTDITLIVEPLNTRVDHPGYYLETSAEAFDIIDQVASPNVKIVFDIYHQQITEGNLIPNITANIDKIAYFHAAGHPGRAEPWTGEIDYANVFSAIRHTGYSGYIGLEYFPKADPTLSLKSILEKYGTANTIV